MDPNPLTSDGFPIAFDRVRPEHVVPAVDTLLADAQARLDALGALDEAPTFANAMRPLEAISERLSLAMSVVHHLEHVATNDALRAAVNETQPRVSAFNSKIPLSAPLWRIVSRYAASEEARGLKGARARFVEQTVAYFKRHGADLPDEGKTRLEAIDVELTKLTLRYSQNVLDATNAFELVVEDEAKLAGLPESARGAAKQSAQQKNLAGWRFTLQAPSYAPVMMYLDDASLREKMYRAMSTRATSGDTDNRNIVAQVLALRDEKAKLLGYANFADLILEDRMAKSGATARAFVEDLEQKTRPSFDRETAALRAFRKSVDGRDALDPWDIAYWAEKQRKALYAFDDEALRPYFALDRCLEGLFEIASRIYGVRFETWEGAPRWDDSVRSYKVLDADDGRWLAGIYIDPYPRETKQGGAWMHGVLARARSDEDRRHIGLIVANVTPPVGDQPALLAHRDVETLFHEFGHLMHHCLSEAELRSHAGTQVAWDFVELPSQILENWCWERAALDLFARHHESNARVPDELLDAMRRARTYRAASDQMRQLGFAVADLKLHVDYPSEREDNPIAYARSIMSRFSAVPLPDDYAMVASFDHLFGSPVGYAAAYYSYKWAEVLDADAFTRFKENGLFDAETGRAFRKTILARGDDEDPALMFRDFMGREPRLEPLLERLGLG